MNAGDGDGQLVVAPSASAPRIAELIGARVGEGTPAGAIVIQALEGGEDPARLREALAGYRRHDVAAVVVLAGSPAERAAGEAALVGGDHIPPSRLVHVASLDEDGGEALRERLVAALPGDLATVSGRHPKLRPAAASTIVGRNARYAAALAGIRRAGMPALTVLQVKMLADLAAGHARPLGPNRAADVAAVVGAGFAWRLAGRASLGLVSLPAWLVRGGVAWAGTRALGAIAHRRLGAAQDLTPIGGADAPAPPSRDGT